MSVRGGLQSEAPFFRLRDLGDGVVTGLISHKMVEAAREHAEPPKPEQS
jgi:hypothetical protein